jgi:hypothetical protein
MVLHLPAVFVQQFTDILTKLGAELYHAKSRYRFPACLICSRASYASGFCKFDGSRPQLQSYHSVPSLS